MLKSIIQKYLIKYLPFVIILLFGILYLTIAITNHYYFRTFCYDYAIHNNAFYDYAHLRWNKVLIAEPPYGNFMLVHISIILMILSPFYWIIGWLTGTYTLLILQVIVILLGGYYVYLLVKDVTKKEILGILALFHFFIIQGHFSVFTSDYTDTTVGVSLVPAFIYYLHTRKYILSSLFFAVILLTKENMPLWLIFISLALIFTNLKDKKYVRINLVYMGVSAIYFVFVFSYLIPFLVQYYNGYYKGFTYSALGTTPFEAVGFIIKNPWETFRLFFVNHSGETVYDGIKAEFYYVFLLSGGILLFMRPVYFLMIIPIIAQKMLNDDYQRWGINWFYSIEIVSVLSYIIFVIISKFKNTKIQYIIAVFVILSTGITTIVKLNTRTSKWYNPMKEKFYDTDFFKPEMDFDAKQIRKTLQIIPDNAKVVATERIVPHLAYRDTIYHFPNVKDADYMVLFDYGYYPLSKEEYFKQKAIYLNHPNWEIIEQKPFLTILKKNFKIHSTKSANIHSITCDAEILKTETNVYLGSDNYMFGNGNTQSADVFLSGKRSIMLNAKNPYGFTITLENILPGSEIAVTAWRYCNKNEKKTGCIIISDILTPNENFYSSEKVVEEKNGWEKLELIKIVNNEFPENRAKIFLLNLSEQNVYFDDISILIK